KHPVSTRPFRPTEIPSPIYGFKRPKHQEARRRTEDGGQRMTARGQKEMKEKGEEPLLLFGRNQPMKPLLPDFDGREETAAANTVEQTTLKEIKRSNEGEKEQPSGIAFKEIKQEQSVYLRTEETKEEPSLELTFEEQEKEQAAHTVVEGEKKESPIAAAFEEEKQEQPTGLAFEEVKQEQSAHLGIKETKEEPLSVLVFEEEKEQAAHTVVGGEKKESPIATAFEEEKQEQSTGLAFDEIKQEQTARLEDEDTKQEASSELTFEEEEKEPPMTVTFEEEKQEQLSGIAFEEQPVSLALKEEDTKDRIEEAGEPRLERGEAELSGKLDEQEHQLHAASQQSQQGENEKAAQTNESQMAREHPEEQETSTPPRSEKKVRTVPFNVLMLKQDRRKLEERKKHVVPAREEATNENREQQKAENRQQTQEKISAVELDQPSVLTADFEPEYYVFPDISYLTPPIVKESSEDWLLSQMHVLNETLKNFNVRAKVVNVTEGPAVTRFEVQPEPGVKVNKVTNLTDDIKLSLAAKDIRMEAPIPGKHTIGIEVPNKESRPVFIREIITSQEFKNSSSPLTTVLGLDISGEPIVTDLSKMPHGLIAGATGSGKSVCINSILVSLLYKAAPHELKLLLIDPKMVELAPYNGIPHLVSPVITDVKAATAALKWAVEEMERRYELFVHAGVRDIKKYNEKVAKQGRKSEHLPYMVIIIDELADLMMMSPADVEEAICRIAQKARACGIHLIIATQRPSVDVITGLIKANIPTRIAFSVSSQVDSRTILDSGGAEKLLGRGDMLFLNNGSSEPVRLQGTFVSDEEIDKVVEHAIREQEPNYLFKQEELLQKAHVQEVEDELFHEACEFVVQQGGASTSLLQRHFHIGYNRAARLIEMMETQGIVSEQRAGKPRDVLISEEDLHALNESSTL
ncbi:MAG TPA: DNA translocase FtsK, partial [Chondromyces sp.]|nr:DNA translocase FtsK [Chondromyces sp.]